MPPGPMPPPPQGPPIPPHGQMSPHGPGPVISHGSNGPPIPPQSMGQGPMGQGPMGQGPMGQGPMGQGPMGQGPMGQGPMGQGPMGQGPMGQGPIGLMDPASNNAPLQFNPNKGKPPMPIPGKMIGPEMPEELQGQNRNGEGQSDHPSPPHSAGQDLSLPGPGMLNPGMMMNPGYNPNMMMMPLTQFGQFGYMGPMGPGMGADMPPPKEVINLKNCVLYPPPPNAPPPSTRERPPGCRTIFVGGLPENLTEEMLREIFENCGPITSIRLSKKNFAHVRFEVEEGIDRALYISGYRIKVNNKDDKANTGRVHVDYAQARDDLYEWECKQRALAREHRHRQRLEEERLRPPSPPPIIHYSDHEAGQLMEKLKGDETFMKGTQVLVTWLDRGDCSRRSSNIFYSMIQSVNSHVRRLMNEKAQHDLELEQMKLKFGQRFEGIIRQFEQIEKVFSVASKQKAWDHFSKAQRKNLDMWRKQAEEIRRMNQEEFLRDREEAEMEMSDSEDGESMSSGQPPKRPRRTEDIASLQDQAMKWAALKSQAMADEEPESTVTSLKEENDSLKCQLEAYKNEVDLLKQEQKNYGDEKDKQLRGLQQALQGMQQQLIGTKQKMVTHEEEMVKLRTQAKNAAAAAAAAVRKSESPANDGDDLVEGAGDQTTDDIGSSVIMIQSAISEKEARLIGLISTFLHVHPFGASIDYMRSYLQRLDMTIYSSEIEELLEKLPSVFRQDLFGVGATLEKRWKFIGFEERSHHDL